MAVALPPPLVPQLGDVEELRTRSGGAIVLEYQEFHLHVAGTDVLHADQLTAAIGNADTLSNAVRAIASAYYGAGYPAAQLVYALQDKDLYIMVLLGAVTTAAGPDYLTQYFGGMDATHPFTDQKMEPRRTLASLHADRAGDNATPLLILQRDGTYQFDIRPDQDGTNQTFVRAEVSNPGNRFVGRHFGDLDVKQNTRWGDELHFFGRRSLDFMNQDSEGVDFTEFDLAWNRVTPYGVFGAAASNSVYHIMVRDVLVSGHQGRVDLPVKGEQTYGELDWFDLLMASFNSRWTLQARVGRTDKTLEGEAFGVGDQQHELYNWAEVGTQFSYLYPIGAQRLSMVGGVAFGKGLSRNDRHGRDTFSGLAPPDLNYFLWKPSMRLELITSAQINFSIDASGQISKDSLPEQQQWVLGGLGTGSAYLPGVAVGDAGFNGRFTIEPQALQPWAPLKIAPRVFVEYGYTKLENAPDNSALARGREAIADAGIDIAATAWNWLELGLTWAEPFYDQDIGQKELDASRANLYFRVATKFAF